MAEIGGKPLVTPQTLWGFQDLFPDEMILRNAVVDKIRTVYEKYGFLPLDTPILEYLVTLIGTGGEDTNKQLFRLQSPEHEPIAMRFDLTVPFARLIAQYPEKLKLPFRRYHIGPVFRADKPAVTQGRFRQFTQFDIDAAGSQSVSVDAEIVAAMCDVFRVLGLANEAGASSANFQIRINNRKLIDAILAGAGIASSEKEKHVLRVLDKLQKVGVENVRRELGGGRKDEESGDKIVGVELEPQLIERLLSFTAVQHPTRGAVTEALAASLPKSERTTAALQDMRDLAAALDSLGVSDVDAVFDPSLARGLDYYTGPVFEAWLPSAPEFGSVMGGGRYDGLVTRFTHTAIPATGASIGLDRFIAALKHTGKVKLEATTVRVLVVTLPGVPIAHALSVAAELRRSDIPTQLYFAPDVEGASGGKSTASMREQLAFANANEIPVAVILGEDELKNGTVSIKDLRAGKDQRAGIQDRDEYRRAGKTAQMTVERGKLVSTVAEILGRHA